MLSSSSPHTYPKDFLIDLNSNIGTSGWRKLSAAAHQGSARGYAGHHARWKIIHRFRKLRPLAAHGDERFAVAWFLKYVFL
jgi:hypothetical protein